MSTKQSTFWKTRKQLRKTAWLKEFNRTAKTTEPAREIFRELGQHKDYPNWPNISEQEHRLIMDYAGQSRFDRADLMFISRMRDKIRGTDKIF